MEDPRNMRPHQIAALRKLKNGSVLWGGVGSGKSMVAVEYYVEHEKPKDVYVITTAKKRDSLDWDKEFVRKGIGTRLDATTQGVLKVDSWNNIHNYIGVTDAFFIFDEQRAIGSGKWSQDFIKIAKKNRWIMLSATPGDVWLDYIPLFVANGFYKNRTAFKHEHVVYNSFSKHPKVERYLGVNKLIKLRNEILVHMPYDKTTVRHTKVLYADYDTDQFELVVKKRWHVYENRPIRDIAELFTVMRKVVNSDPSRLKEVRALMRKHPKLIVFYSFNYELELLRELCADESDECTDLQIAEWNGHKHEEIPKSNKWVYLVQYVAGSEGWNCTETNAMAFYSFTYSYKNWEQAHGRIDRLNTPFTDLYYYIIRSKSVIDTAIWRSLKEKKSFNHAHYDVRQLEWN